VTFPERIAWTLLESEPADGPVNMAIDEVLMESVRRSGVPILRLYRWSPPCLSLGRNQPAPDPSFHDRLRHGGIDLVRRLTGGRAVLHDDELTYAAVMPERSLGTARLAYHRINEALAAGLARLGAEASLATGGRGTATAWSAPCFVDPAPGEVLAHGRKLVGSAQVREDRVLLQHGSLPLRRGGSARALTDADHAGLVGAPAYLDEVVGARLPLDQIVRAILEAWSDRLGDLTRRRLTPAERRRAALLRAKYASEHWTLRR